MKKHAGRVPDASQVKIEPLLSTPLYLLDDLIEGSGPILRRPGAGTDLVTQRTKHLPRPRAHQHARLEREIRQPLIGEDHLNRGEQR